MIVVLAGGVGAARFLRGVVRTVPPRDVTVIGNTGDDIEIYGVHVSPDLDIVTYTLAGENDEDQGWGLRGDTHTIISELRAHGTDTWFTLGDRDFAICLARSLALAAGEPLSVITARILDRFGVEVRLLPMTDDPVATHVLVSDAEGHELDLHFQEYWVARRARDDVLAVHLRGVDHARAAPGVLEALKTAEAVLIAPSNPVVSIGTILQVPGIRDGLRETSAPVVGVSPIVGGAPVRGMADKLMPAAGVAVTAWGAASLYRDVLNGWVIDLIDAELAGDIERDLGVRVRVAQTMMHTIDDAAALAASALEFARTVGR